MKRHCRRRSRSSTDFDGLIAFRHAQALQQIQDSAQKRKATRVEITAYRASSLLSNDKTLLSSATTSAGAGPSRSPRC